MQPNELFLGAFGGFPTSWPLALQLLEGRALSLVVLVKVGVFSIKVVFCR